MTTLERLAEVGGIDGAGLLLCIDPPRAIRFVRIDVPGFGQIALNEVLVSATAEGRLLRNVAQGATATQSSTVAGDRQAHEALNWNLNGDASALSFPSTDQWWELDLAAVHDVTAITILNAVTPEMERSSPMVVSVAVDGEDWDVVHDNRDARVVANRVASTLRDMARGVTATGSAATWGVRDHLGGPYDLAGACDIVAGHADELANELASLEVEGLDADVPPSLSALAARTRDLLRERWQSLLPRNLDVPGNGGEEIGIHLPGEGGEVAMLLPAGATPQVRAGSRALDFEHQAEDDPRAAPLVWKLRTQDCTRMISGIRVHVAPLRSGTSSLQVDNQRRQPGYGFAWQLWHRPPGGEWSLVYDHAGLLLGFHRLLRVVCQLTTTDVVDLELLVNSLALARRNRPAYVLVRAVALDTPPDPDQVVGFHEAVESTNDSPTLQLPVLLTKHDIGPAMKHQDRRAHALAMAEVERQFASLGMATLVFYGSLLGLIRGGDFIDHDDDVDMIVLTKAVRWHDLARTRESIIGRSVRLGFDVHAAVDWPAKNLHVFPEIDGVRVRVDVFPTLDGGDVIHCWSDRDARFIPMERRWTAPTGRYVYEGVSLPVPADPVAVLHRLYGDSWQTPLRHYGHKFRLRGT